MKVMSILSSSVNIVILQPLNRNLGYMKTTVRQRLSKKSRNLKLSRKNKRNRKWKG
jgi:hypothetical protein